MVFFGLISEVPFHLFASGEAFVLSHQNIMFTFAWALAGLSCYEQIASRERGFLGDFVSAVVLLVFLAGSLLFRLDYNMTATAIIFVFYLLRYKTDWVRNISVAAVYAAFRNKGMNWFGLLGFIPIFMYNGRRGRGLKWLFYIFYPAHLLGIWLIDNML